MTNQPPSFNESVDDQSSTTPTPLPERSDVFPSPLATYTVSPITPDNPPWAQPPWLGALKAFFTWVASVACLLFVPLILVVPYVIYKATTTSTQAAITNLEGDKVFLFLSVLGVIPAHLLTFLITYLVVTGRRNYPLAKTLGLSWPRSWGPVKGMLISAVIGIVLFGLGALITWYFPGEKTQLDLLIESSYGARLVTAFLAVVTAPLVEEVVYRGILYPGIASGCASLVAPFRSPEEARVVGAGVGIAAVSFLFAGVHFLQYQNNLAVIGVITLVSITLTTVRAYTGRLLPCFVVHLVFNGVQAIIILLYPFLPKPEQTTPKPTPSELLGFVLKLFS